MTKEKFFNEATNVLVFDPSQNYTGWVLYKPALNKIDRYGCIRKDRIMPPDKEYSGVMEERFEFQKKFSWQLSALMKPLDPKWTQVVMEKPIGSQSSRAAWALAMASQGVVSTTVAKLHRDPIGYTEHEAKKHMFQTGTVEKSKTMKYMWAHWKSQGIEDPEERWTWETSKVEMRKMMEACADAMLILNYHLHVIPKNW